MRLLNDYFPRLSDHAVALAGHRIALASVVLSSLCWMAVGLAAGFPVWWFLVANMVATLVTVFILLLVQHSQNRDMQALQVKVDELIRASEAGNHLIGLERRPVNEAAALIKRRSI